MLIVVSVTPPWVLAPCAATREITDVSVAPLPVTALPLLARAALVVRTTLPDVLALWLALSCAEEPRLANPLVVAEPVAVTLILVLKFAAEPGAAPELLTRVALAVRFAAP